MRRSRAARIKRALIVAILTALAVSPVAGAENTGGAPVVAEKIILDKIWSAVPVGFCLLTHGDKQYVAYYNAERRTVVGMRTLTDAEFIRVVLPSESGDPPRQSKATSTIQGWDSHNYLTMAVDETGHLHLSGNMHVDPLLYFRSEKPGDVRTMKQIKSMVGKNEDRCTYPKFMHLKNGELLYHYRDGSSGKGNEIYNIYDTRTRNWRRFLDTPLIDGLNRMNAYQRGPLLGPDGMYHLLWMWRDTSDAATNHDISYARSRDMRNWENAAGQALELPITINSKGTIIDPVPAGGGIINTIHRLGFDSGNRVVVSYHKHDGNGNTQAYAARYEKNSWNIRQISSWQGRHIFEGGGSGPATYGTSISLGTIEKHSPGKLALPYQHWKAGKGNLLIDEDTLAPLGVAPPAKKAPRYPREITKVESEFPGMRPGWCADSGNSPDPSIYYVMRWETLGPNRDRPRTGELPDNSDLILYKIRN
jgi:hypothetical protein